jgi:AcrR family transcriptional regulator
MKHNTQTRHALELAIRRFRHGRQHVGSADGKISIAGVAREAGVSNATIHNRYPDIADRIRAIQSRAARALPKVNPDTLEAVQRRLAEAREEIRCLLDDLRKSQSINLRLSKENEMLEARITRLDGLPGRPQHSSVKTKGGG